VANCGLLLGVFIWAIIFPPNAGLIWSKSVFDWISSIVQSAVRPVLNLAASLGANDLPNVVPPTNTIVGFILSIKFSIAFEYGSILKSLNSSSSYTNTSSTP